MIETSLPERGPALSDTLLRQFAALWAVFCGGLAWVGYAQGRIFTPSVLLGLALLFGPAGLIWPAWIRPVYLLLTTLTYPVGWVVSQLLLAVLYYGLFTPFAALSRLMRRDVLRRKRPDVPSYWVAKPAVEDVQSYFRQS